MGTLEVGLIDCGFKPGKKANERIGEAVGYEADFCGTEDAITDVLEQMRVFETLIQLRDDDGHHFCVFDYYGELLTTRAYKKPSQSLAEVAYFLVVR